MKKLLLVPLIALLLLATVYAQEDFTAFGAGQIDALQCSTHEETLTIINSGTESSTYFIEVEGTAAKWAAFAPISFSLAPGQSIEVKSYIEVPCDARGDHTLDIYVVTAYGLEKAILQDIYVSKPQNIDIRANVWQQEIDPCAPAMFNLTIVNPEDFEEEYTFTVDKFAEDTIFSSKKLTIPGKATKELLVDIQPSSCDVSGEFDIIFTAKAEQTGVAAEIDLSLEISNKGITSIAEGVSKIKTDYAEKGVELNLLNKGDEPVNYSLRADGADWITVQPKILTVAGGESQKFNLIFKPSNATEKGKYPVKVVAASSIYAEYSKEIIVQLGEPTIFDTLFVEYPLYAFFGAVLLLVIIILIYFAFRKYNSEEAKLVRAKRRAEREKKKAQIRAQKEQLKKQREKERLKIKQDKERAQKLKELEKKRKERELEKANAKAIKKYDKQLKTEFQLVPKEKIEKGKLFSKKWVYNLVLFIIILAIIGVAVQYRQFFWKHIYYVLAGIAILIILLFLKWLGRLKRITARWRGIVLSNEVLLMDINWRKGLQAASFMLDVPAKKVKAVIRKGRTRHSRYHRPKDFVYQYFRADCSVDAVKQSKFRFKVSKKWLEKREIKDVALAMLKGDSYQKIKTTRENSDDKYIYYKAVADDFGQFAIVGTSTAKKRYRPYWIAWLILAILVVIAVGAGARMYSEDQIQAKGIPMQMWNQDEQHMLDLKDYFKDPDKDPLTFTVSKIDNIEIEIRDGVAYFTPDFKWSGQKTVTFTAVDDHEGKAMSNPVKLVVKKKLLPKALTGYLKYILAGAIILIVLIAFFILRRPVMQWLDEDE